MTMTTSQARQLLAALTPGDDGRDRGTYQHDVLMRVAMTKVALEHIAAGGDVDRHLRVLAADIRDVESAGSNPAARAGPFPACPRPQGGNPGPYDYEISRQLTASGLPFFGLIMAAMRQADTDNAAALREAFPETWAELQARYHAPGGILSGAAAAARVVPQPD